LDGAPSHFWTMTLTDITTFDTQSHTQVTLSSFPTDAAATRKGRNPGFFQVNFSVLKQMADLGFSFETLAAYLVICAGVDSKRGERVSTHGARSVSARVGIPYREAQRQLETLRAEGFIVPMGQGQNDSTGPMSGRWSVSGPEPDTQISQTFVNGNSSRSEFPLTSIRIHLRRSGAISSNQAKVDLLLLFAWLHRDYDLGTWAGVSPQIWHQSFQHVPPDWQPDEAARGGDFDNLHLELEDGNLRVVTAALPSRPLISTDSAIEFLSNNGMEAGDTLVRLRIETAFTNLLSLKLAYKAVVAWHGDPSYPGCEALGTLHINDAWGRANEPSAQAEHNRRIWRANAIPHESEVEHFGNDRKHGTERYRCLVWPEIAKETFVVRQLRLRHWAATQAAVDGRELEKSRTDAFSNC
jgi:hypothetical protein